jgi:hypothetical protein
MLDQRSRELIGRTRHDLENAGLTLQYTQDVQTALVQVH